MEQILGRRVSLITADLLLEAIGPMTVVQIEKPEDTKLADWFAELRLWFDNNDCNSILSTEVERVKNGPGFNIKFADDVQARLFASTSAKYEPTIRRKTKRGQRGLGFDRCHRSREKPILTRPFQGRLLLLI
jgi:hypothetical protein